ncbi:retrovirus-related pol polyprotein from transposon TNT 1-94 [Tanacetum coccineum]
MNQHSMLELDLNDLLVSVSASFVSTIVEFVVDEELSITPTKVVPIKEATSSLVETSKLELKVYSRRPKHVKNVGSSKKDKIVESKNANNSKPNHTWGSNAIDIPSSSSLVNDMLSRLFSVRFENDQIAKIMGYGGYQLENVIISRVSRGGALGIHSYALGKSKKSSHQPKAEDTNQEKLYLLHMDMCGPMRVAEFLRTKDEAPEAIIKCIKNIQIRLNATVCNVRTDNGTEFVNQTLREFYENVGISHETFVARTPQQNDVVERRNRTLVEVARTMLIFSKAPLFLWLMHDKNSNLSFLHVFGSLCYPTNDSEDLGKLNAKADIGCTIIKYSINTGTRTRTRTRTRNSPIISLGFEESPKTPLFHDDPLHESLHEDSTSQGSSSNVRPTHTLFEHLGDGLRIII